MRLSAPLYLFDQKDSSLKVVPLPSVPLLQRGKAEVQPPWAAHGFIGAFEALTQ